MKSKTKLPNKYSKTYNNLRQFLRLLSYGCYHRNIFKKFNINPRSYDDDLRQLRFFLPPKHLQETHHQKKSHFTFAGDAYHGSNNYLIHSFKIKSLLPSYCLYTITLLQTIYASAVPLSLNDLCEKIEYALTKYGGNDDADVTNALRRRLKELVELGLVSKQKSPSNSLECLYGKIQNPLSGLRAENAIALQMAIHFYKNIALLSVPGYDLEHTLCKMYKLPTTLSNNYQFKNNNYVRILDEEILFTIVSALKQQQLLVIHMNPYEITPSTDKLVLPIALQTDYHYNRQYLIAESYPNPDNLKHSNTIMIRIDAIREALPQKTTKISPPASPPAPCQIIELRCTYSSADERSYLLHAFHERCLQTEITQNGAGFFHCNILIQDPRKLLPWIRTLHSHIEILPSPTHHLRERIKKDLKEALKNYDQLVQ